MKNINYFIENNTLIIILFLATILAIILFSGAQLISLGFISEFVLRIYNQVRNRPLYIIDKIIKNENDK